MHRRWLKRSTALFSTLVMLTSSVDMSAFAEVGQAGIEEKKETYFYDFTEMAENAADNYIGVDSNSIYSAQKLYGWTEDTIKNVTFVQRNAGKTSVRENGIAYGTQESTFYVDVLEEGTYLISAAVGDRLQNGITTRNMSLSVNGKEMMSEFHLEAGMTKEVCTTVEASSDRQLAFEFSGDSWTISSFEIRKFTDYESNQGTKNFIAGLDGTIVIETETALEQSRYAWTEAGAEAEWQRVYGVSGYGMQYGPNTTVGKAYTTYDASSKNAPKMHFQVNFNEAGTYIAWALVKASCADDDSVFVLIDNKSNAMPFTNKCGDTKGEYVWMKMESKINLVVEEAGVHTISVYGREDGMNMDKLILTKDASFVPEGIGGRMYREKEEEPQSEDFALFVNGETAGVYTNLSEESDAVVRAASDLCSDIEMVTGKKPNLEETIQAGKPAIVIGTIGKNDMIDELISSGRLDVSGVENEWEAFTIQIIDNPSEEIEQALVIAGSDKRGCIYGIYELSEYIGVSPWYWWADVPTIHKESIIVKKTEIEKKEKPDVKYRGIFLNDEENFSVWTEKFKNDTDSQGTPNTKAYEKVFELMLRLKANVLWPAMHEESDAFNKYINPETGRSYCAEAADHYGIIMSSSHCEMLLANNPTEWVPWCEKNEGKYNLVKIKNDWKTSYDYTVNSEAINVYWEERVAQNYQFENIYMLGLRAVHDAGILCSGLGENPTYEQKAAVVKQAVEAQLEILRKYEAKYKEETGEEIVFAKSFCPYKEAAEYYKYDLGLPEETLILWADDNYGYVRQFPTEKELNNYAGSGVYYHVSYWGWPCSYLWMATTPLSLMYEEMYKAYTAGSDAYWILNVGDLKPSEIPMEFFLRLGWNIDSVQESTIRDYIAETMKRDFTVSWDTGKEIADILTEVYQICNAKKPEFHGLNQGTEYSLTDYGDEGQKTVNRMTELLQKSQSIYAALPEEEKDAYYEMIHYMIKSVKLTLEKNIYAQKSQLYMSQGRFLSVNAYADAAYQAYENILKEIHYYNINVADGKWQGILDPYQNVNGLPKISGEPEVKRVFDTQAIEGIDAVCEGQTTGSEEVELKFYSLADEKRFLDIFTTGFHSANYQIMVDSCIYLMNGNGERLQYKENEGKHIYEGEVDIEKRFFVGIDWSAISEKKGTAEIVVSDKSGFSKVFPVSYTKGEMDTQKTGYYETDGVVSIEAEHYSNSVAVNGQEWRVFHDLGNSGDSLKVYPDTHYENKSLFGTDTVAISEAIQKAPYVEYNIYFETTGTYSGDFYRLPTLNEGKYEDGTGKSCRVLVGLDDGMATLLRCNSVVIEKGGSLWSYGVQGNQDIYAFTIQIDTPGWHTLKVIKSDAGITFDKIVLTNKEVAGDKTSKLGAPESYQTICEMKTSKLAELPYFEKDTIIVGEGKTVEKRLYDFTANISKIQSGYIGVTADTVSRKYGWSKKGSDMAAEYRNDAPKTSDRDKGFVYGTQEAVFQITGMQAGRYNVGLASGDRDKTGITVKNMSVSANGVKVLEDIQVASGTTMEYAFVAEVDANGRLLLTFSGDLWAVTSLEIWPYTEARKDNGTGAFEADYKGDINIEAEAALENSDYAKILAASDGSGASWFQTNGISGMALFFGPNSTLAQTSTNYGSNKAPKAEYTISVEEDGEYNIWILTKLQSQEDDSVFVSVDENTLVYINDIVSTNGDYVWKKMTTTSITKGIHKISIIGREDGLAFDKIMISKSSSAPVLTGGKMIRQGAKLDMTELENAVDEAKKELLNTPNSTLQKLVEQAEAVINQGQDQKEADRLYDEIMAAISGNTVENKDLTVLQRAMQYLKMRVEASENDFDKIKGNLKTVYDYLDLLKESFRLPEIEGKVAQYSFEGNWKNTFNEEQLAVPGTKQKSAVPQIEWDNERGNVLHMEAGDVNNNSYVSVQNPFKNQNLENGATVSIWVKSNVIDNYGFIWSAKTRYNYLWMAGAPYFGYDGSNGFVDINCPHNLPGSSDKQGYLKNNEWNLVTTSITDNNVTVYVNGNKLFDSLDREYTAGINTNDMTRVISLLKTADTLEIGGNNKYWGSADMLADDFTLYNRAFTEEEAKKQYITDVTAKDVLKTLVFYAENEAAKTDIYTLESIKAYKNVIDNSQEMLDNIDILSEQLLETFKNLYEAENLLKVKQPEEENPTTPDDEKPTLPDDEKPSQSTSINGKVPSTSDNSAIKVYLFMLLSITGAFIVSEIRKRCKKSW